MITMNLSGVESWREYVYEDGFVYRIVGPKTLYIKPKLEGDSHRIECHGNPGVTHYIPAGWRVIRWQGQTVA